MPSNMGIAPGPALPTIETIQFKFFTNNHIVYPVKVFQHFFATRQTTFSCLEARAVLDDLVHVLFQSFHNSVQSIVDQRVDDLYKDNRWTVKSNMT